MNERVRLVLFRGGGVQEDVEPIQLKPWMMATSNIGKRYWSARISAIPDKCRYKKFLTRVAEKPQTWVEEGKGVVFVGPPGTGKTAAAAIISKIVVSRRGTAFMASASEIGDIVMSRTPQLFGDYDGKFRIKHSDVAVFDDLGVENCSSVIEPLIRKRYNESLPIVVTTMMKQPQFETKYGKALSNLILGSCDVITMGSYNWREEGF